MVQKVYRLLIFLSLSLLMAASIVILYYSVAGRLDHLSEDFYDQLGNADSEFFQNGESLPALTRLKKFRSDITGFANMDTLLLGVHDRRFSSAPEVVDALSDSLNAGFGYIQLYQSWGSGVEHRFPQEAVAQITKRGAVPVITWEPWLKGFDTGALDGLRSVNQRDKGGLADVASGVYDRFILDWAYGASKVESPILIRFAHEMNDPYRYAWGPHNNSGADYVAAWHRIDSLFNSVGADNCLWIWGPHLAYGLFDEYYPGDELVDYVGFNVLNFGSSVHWSEWQSFEKMFGRHYNALTAYKKPMLIMELGSLAYGGDRAQWYRQALDSFPNRYPMVNGLLFFNVVDDQTVSNKTIDWGLNNDAEALEAVRQSIFSW